MKCVRKVMTHTGYITRVDEGQKEYTCMHCKCTIEIGEPNFVECIWLGYNSKIPYTTRGRYCVKCGHNIFKYEINMPQRKKKGLKYV